MVPSPRVPLPPGADGGAPERLARLAAVLAGSGVGRGLLGPAEADRVWERHVLPSVLLADLVPDGVLVDVGTGAGLPGLVLAALDPGREVVLVEPRWKAVAFCLQVVDDLALASVRVRHRRAERCGVTGDVLTARAVRPPSEVLALLGPLVRLGGEVVAVVGAGTSPPGADAAGAGLGRARLEHVRGHGTEVTVLRAARTSGTRGTTREEAGAGG